jgi:hypothetical protein
MFWFWFWFHLYFVLLDLFIKVIYLFILFLYIYVLIDLLVELGTEHRASHFQSKNSTARVIPPVHFAVVNLEMGFLELFAWTMINP